MNSSNGMPVLCFIPDISYVDYKVQGQGTTKPQECCQKIWDLRLAPARKEVFRRDRCVALPKSQLTNLARWCTAL